MSDGPDALPISLKEGSLRRRPWLIAGGIAIVLLGALVYFFLRDDAPPEDADFKPQWTEGGGPRNPLVVFMEEVAAADRNLKFDLSTIEWEYESGEDVHKRDEQFMEDAVAKNTFVFAAFEKLMATDPALWRWPGDRGTSIPFPDNSSQCQEITEAALWTKFELLLHRGEHREAAKLVLAIHKFGHGLVKAEGTTIYHRQALMIQKAALVGLTRALKNEASPKFLGQIQEYLSGKEPDTSDLIELIKWDYVLFRNLSQGITNHEFFEEIYRWQPTYQWLWYRPNRTARLDLNFRRGLVTALESDWGGAQAYVDTTLDPPVAQRKSKWRALSNSNAFGRYLWREHIPEDLVRDTAAHVSTHRMLVTSLAIRRYELAHHALPATLQELVPEFLAAVPVDPMNRAPIMWDPIKRELLARGLRRPGPHTIALGRSDDSDVTFLLWWKTP